jgi:hypothetical protein
MQPLGLGAEGGAGAGANIGTGSAAAAAAAASFPLSPKSERAYTRISHEFDVLFQALQADGEGPVRALPDQAMG